MNVRIALLILSIGVARPSMAENLHYPPVFKDRIDFAGMRFIVSNQEKQLFGMRVSLMKKNVIVTFQPIPLHAFPGRLDMYLVKIKADSDLEDDEKENEDSDTFIRFVKTLNDLRGFVKIRTETDALEFLRFGSSFTTGRNFEENIKEVFCIRSEDTKKIAPLVKWGLVEECGQAGFFPPQIINPKPKKKRGKEDDDEGEDDDRRGHFFLITRTVYSRKNNDAQFLRITEEVGPEGQWRILTTQPLGRLNNENILFLGLDNRPENRGRPLTQEEIDEEMEPIGLITGQ